MIYKFKSIGGKFSTLDAQAVEEELEALRVANGDKLKSEDVVQAASNPTSAMHNGFTWDDTEAANKWRLGEAQYLVRHIVVVKHEKDDEPVKAFWSIRVKDEDSSDVYYQSAAVISKNPREYESALRTTLADLAGADLSLQQLRRLAPRERHPVIQKASAHVLHAHSLLQNASNSPPA